MASYEPINRRTQDLDFLVRGISNTSDVLYNVIHEIISIPMDDGFAFSQLEVAPLPHPHMKYTGIRARMSATFGKGQFRVSVDLGYGDIVDPELGLLPLTGGSKGALFESAIEINCYPREFIFAEKLEAVVRYGDDNSRMKDFHDLHVLIGSEHLSIKRLNLILHRVFAHRATPLKLPINLTEEGLVALERSWKAHLRGLPVTNSMPESLKEVVADINDWLGNAIA
ncbi:MAG: nucleotidyl transferase AbiEii/AbiGii toxin family protein [Parachlamydiales bacterium]